MKTTGQYFSVVPLNLQYKAVLTLSLCMESLVAIIQRKAIEQHHPVAVLLVMVYTIVFKSLGCFLKCDH